MPLEMKEVKLLSKGFLGGRNTTIVPWWSICFLFNKRLQKLEGSSLAKLFQCVIGLC